MVTANRFPCCLFLLFVLLPCAAISATFNPQVVAQGLNEQSVRDSCQNEESSNPDQLYGVVTDSSSGQFTCLRCWTGYGSFNGTYPYGQCSTEPLPEPECGIPEGTEKRLATPYRMNSVCHQECRFNGAKRTICVTTATGSETVCLSTYKSTGEYCDDEDGESARPFDDYTDENDCYRSTEGPKYCYTADDSPCPNYTIVDGRKYCRQSGEDESFDSDGDGIPDSEDNDPGNPDSDGDGAQDGQDPDPTNPDTDGDGTPDGQDSDADGNGIPDAEEDETGGADYTEGLCEPDTEVKEPECTSELDDIQCAIFLNNWHLRCQQKQQWEQLYGSPDDEDVKALRAEGDAYFDDENPLNQLPSSEPGEDGVNTINFDEKLNELDDSGFISGSCPSNITYSVYGSSFHFSYQPICDVLSKLHDVIVALGWFAAALIIGRSVTGG